MRKLGFLIPFFHFFFFFVCFFIYLFIRQIPNPTTARSACNNAKEREKKERQGRRAKKKWIKGQRAKLSTPTPATDMLIGHEELNGKQKKERKIQEAGSYGEPIL